MSERVTMPALGESVTEGTVTRWLKNVGDTVAVDEPLLEVSTDKVDTEIPSPVAGMLQEILVQEDETVAVGADLAVIGDGAEGSGGDDQRPPSRGPRRTRRAEQDQQQDRIGGQAEQLGRARGARRRGPVDRPGAAGRATSEPEQPAQASAASSSRRAGRGRSASADRSDGGGSGGGETVKMPALGESVTEGTVTRWLKAEGDDVEVDEPLLEVSTDKVDTEIPSPVAGTLHQDPRPGGRDRPGRRRPRGHRRRPVAVRRPAQRGSAPSRHPPRRHRPQEAPAERGPAEQRRAEQEAARPGGPGRAGGRRPPQAEPQQRPGRTRHRAAGTAPAPAAGAGLVRRDDDGRVGLRHAAGPQAGRRATASTSARLKGTGVGGRIRKQDVLDAAKAAEEAAAAPAAAAPAAAPAAAAPAAPAASRGAQLPRRLAQARHDREDVAAAQDHRQAHGRVAAGLGPADHGRRGRRHQDRPRCGPRPRPSSSSARASSSSFLPFFALAAVEALKAYPSVNASVDGDRGRSTTAPRTSASPSTPSAACSSR